MPISPCAVERRFPTLGDRLLSAVEFLHEAEDDPTAGSPALRRAVVAQAAAEAERLDFRRCSTRVRRVRAVAVLVAAVSGGRVA